MKGLAIFATVAALNLTLALGQVWCPPASVIYPCTCNSQSLYCLDIREQFNLKQIFDNAANFVGDNALFRRLMISGVTSLLEIGEGAIERLAFERITIFDNPNLEYISPLAFNATLDRTHDLGLYKNSLRNDAPRDRDLFDLVNGFKNLRTLDIHDNRISSIPENAFQNLPLLERVILSRNLISQIGSRAFAVGSSSSVLLVDLDRNLIPSVGGLAEDAFDGAKSGGQIFGVTLLCNKRMEYLEQKSFQSLLDQADVINVGSNSPCEEGDADVQRLECDERVDWICDNELDYRVKLNGYRCRNQTGFGDIWEYCAENKKHEQHF